MIKVKRPKQNPVVGVYTPSEPLVEYRRQRFDHSLEILRANGFKIVMGENALAHKGYSAGTVTQRVNDIHSLAQDDNVDIPWRAQVAKAAINCLVRLTTTFLRRAESRF